MFQLRYWSPYWKRFVGVVAGLLLVTVAASLALDPLLWLVDILLHTIAYSLPVVLQLMLSCVVYYVIAFPLLLLHQALITYNIT